MMKDSGRNICESINKGVYCTASIEKTFDIGTNISLICIGTNTHNQH